MPEMRPWLEEGAELKAQKHLRAEHEHPRLVERVLYLVFQLSHSSPPLVRARTFSTHRRRRAS